MSRRQRAKTDLSRRTRTREVKPRILVVCEGEVTEVEYLNGLKQFFGGSLPVNVVPVGAGGDPIHVVKEAIARREDAQTNAKRAKDENLLFEQTWCLVDVDEHTRLGPALTLAKRKGVEAVVSNPCFELWLLFHFQELGSAVDRGILASEKLRRHLPGYRKHIPPGFPYRDHQQAKARAVRAAPAHAETCRRGDNPSTNVWLLVEAIQRVGDAKRW